MVWFQGWENAPEVALASLASWRRFNAGWLLHALTLSDLRRFLPDADLQRILSTEKPPEAASDLVRLELMHRYGGVWADATTLCAKPLDDWLPAKMDSGFFAFERPGPDRMLSTWFLAAESGAYIVEKWRAAAIDYWADRDARDDYFWVHKLFARCYRTDIYFRMDWDRTPKHSAAHNYHFGPNSRTLLDPPAQVYRDASNPPEPVIKLTHKFTELYDDQSLMAALCRFGHGESGNGSFGAAVQGRRLLVGRYGALDGHGTIGDLRSLESVVRRYRA